MANTSLPIDEMQNVAALTAQNLTFEKAQILEQVGAIKMAAITRKFVSVTEIEMLAGIKKSKLYKDLPLLLNGKSVFVTTWEQFCNAIGSSVETVDNNIRNYQRMGAEFFEYANEVGIPQRVLGQIGRLPEDDRQMVIEMAQQEDATKDSVLKVLEQVMAKNAAEKEQATIEKAELEARLKDLEETAEAKDKIIADKNKKVDELAEKLAKKQTGKEPSPEDVGSELTMQLSGLEVAARSDLSRFAEVFEQMLAHGEANGYDHRPQMVAAINQIIRDAEALRERFTLPQEAPTNAKPEWLDGE